MQMKVEKITPAKARLFLDKRDAEHQRKIRPGLVSSYTASMKAGHWVLSPDPICFDDKGRLINAQHRLSAVIESGTTQEFMVCRGLAERCANGVYTIDVIDRQTVRTIGEQLTLRHGYNNGNAVAAAARAVGIMINSGSTSPFNNKIDVPRTLAILDIYGADVLAVLDGLLHGELKIWRKGAIYAPLIVARHVARPQIDEFMQLIASGENLRPGTPAHSLLRWRCNQGMKASPRILLNAVALAAARHYQKEPMKTVNKLTRAGVQFWIDMQTRNAEKVRALFSVA